ncbi:MAG: peroxidase-related enzyme [Hyphomonadaceae bacterium]
MSWIKTVAYEAATGRLKKLYDRVKGPDNNVDNIMMAHSLRPHTMEGHMALYKYVLHHTGNTLPKSFLEMLGVWVSLLNDCAYCHEHHFAGFTRLMDDPQRAAEMGNAMLARDIASPVFTVREREALLYAQELTERPAGLTAERLDPLRAAGFTDGEILEINQVSAYFSYANRTVLGLGISTEGDVLGLSPGNSEDANDWSHS